MNNTERLEIISRYIKDFSSHSFVKGTVGEYKISGLVFTWILVILFNVSAIAFCRSPITFILIAISIVCLMNCTIVFRKEGYRWFLYRISYTVSLELGFLNCLLSAECQGITREYLVMLAFYVLSSLCWTSISVHKTITIIDNINPRETIVKKADQGKNEKTTPIIFIGPGFGLIIAGIFPELVVPIVLLVVPMFYFLMMPHLMVYYYSKKYKLPEELLGRNE